MSTPTSILITGASSGIGEALAHAYARAGVHLALSGRNAERLESVAASCRAMGATVEARVLDVTERPAMDAWVRGADTTHPLDLVIANAGISAGTGGAGETADQAHTIFAVNLDGVLNTALPAIDIMRARSRGQIALVSSVAAFLPLAGTPSYAASKAAVKHWGDSQRPALAREGICLSVICPGFVESAMTATNPFPMPFMMTAEKAARIITKGLAQNKGRIIFPLPMTLLVSALSALPTGLLAQFLARAPKKPALESINSKKKD